jgi:hypothetical protein
VSRRLPYALALLLALVLAAPAGALAEPLADDSGAEWQVEQPAPPPPEEAGVEPSSTPISLGHIGDVEFWEPDRGALITAGNGSTVKPGVWFYDGVRWRELSNQCGATDGRIAWAGPDEFWTISDERAGQAVASGTERPPLEDNTLCHFAPGPGGSLEIVGSYASPPFEGSSYQAMHAAACLSPNDCWFAGNPLPPPQVGVFELHWNGITVEPDPYLPEGRAIWDMVPFEERIFQSMRILSGDRVAKQVPRPPALRKVRAVSGPEESPFESVTSLPLYSASEFSTALDYLHLSAADGTLWAAGGPQVPKPAGSREAGVTIVRKSTEGGWTRVIAPQPSEEEELTKPPPGAVLFPGEVLDSIAAEPGTSSAWIALDTVEDVNDPSPHAVASIARIGSEGAVSDRLELPAVGDPHGPLGAAQRVVCPAEHDCWLTTADGWLLHLATAAEREHPSLESDPVFARVESEEPITFRPHDEGLPQEPSDEVPTDTSGEKGFVREEEVIKPSGHEPVQVTVPLLSHVRSRVVHGSTLQLSFHLATKARVRLLAERRHKVVARTAQETMKAGNRKLELKLDPKRWPTKLNLQTHALAPLPTETTASPNLNTVSTSLVDPNRLLSSGLVP